MENNQMVWKHKAPDSNDLWILPKWQYPFTTGHGVLWNDPSERYHFSIMNQSPVFAQRWKNGNTFVGECVTGRMLEISPRGRLWKKSASCRKAKDGGFAFMRNARRLDNGHFSVWRPVREGMMQTKGGVEAGCSWRSLHSANSSACLTDILDAVADKDQNPKIDRRTPEGNDLGNIECGYSRKPLKFSEVFSISLDGRFPDYELDGTREPEKKVHLLLVDRQKNVLYSLENTRNYRRCLPFIVQIFRREYLYH